MGDCSILSMFIMVIVACVGMICAANLPGADRWDVRWVTATMSLVIAVCVFYGAGYLWGIERSLRLLNRLLIDHDNETLNPLLKGSFQSVLRKLAEIWKWGAPR